MLQGGGKGSLSDARKERRNLEKLFKLLKARKIIAYDFLANLKNYVKSKKYDFNKTKTELELNELINKLGLMESIDNNLTKISLNTYLKTFFEKFKDCENKKSCEILFEKYLAKAKYLKYKNKYLTLKYEFMYGQK
jgi:hypothetical protein